MKKIICLLLLCSTALLANAQCQSAFTYTVSGNSAAFTNLSTYTTSPTFYWLYGDGSGTTTGSPQVAPHSFQYAGTYSVCLTLQDTLCSSSFCDTIKITAAPNPPCNAWFSHWQDTVSPYPVQFTCFPYGNNPPINKSNTWDFGDGSPVMTTANNVVTHQYTASGTYSVCNTAISLYNDTCTWCKTINATPCNTQLLDSFAYSVLQGTATFTNYCSGATIPVFSWSFGDGGFSSAPNPSHTYQYNGSYIVCLNYSDTLWGCAKSYCTTVNITNAATDPCIAMAAFEWDTITPYTIHYSDISISNIVSRLWTFPNGNPSTSTAQNPVIVYPNNNFTTVSLNVTNQSGVSCTYTMQVWPLPYCKYTKSNFTIQPTSTPHVWTVNNNSVLQYPAAFYDWTWGDGTYSQGVAPTHTYANPGWYTICLRVTDMNNCSSNFCAHDSLFRFQTDNSMVTVNVVDHTTTGMKDISLEEVGITLYPNPSEGLFTVGSQRLSIETAEVFNVFGQLVYSQNIKEQKTIDLTSQPAGIYWLKLFSGENVVMGKLVITQ